MRLPPQTRPRRASPCRPTCAGCCLVALTLGGLISCRTADAPINATAGTSSTSSGSESELPVSSSSGDADDTSDSSSTVAAESGASSEGTSTGGESGSSGAGDSSTTGRLRPPPSGQIVFDTNSFGSLYIATVGDDGPPTNLTNDDSDNRNAHWAPDGERIAFESDRTGINAVWLMDADGGNLVQLTDDPDHESDPRFSPNGDVIALRRNSELHIIDLDDLSDLFVAGGPAIRMGGWSPDGLQLTWSTRDGMGDINRIGVDGSNPVMLTNDRFDDHSAVWSPDGTQLAFVSDRDGDDAIYVMSADGSGLAALTGGANEDDTAKWSPDGTQIAFLRSGIGEHLEQLMLINSDGSDLHAVTAAPDIMLGFSWSPDGEYIAYSAVVGVFPSVVITSTDGEDVSLLAPSFDTIQGNPIWRPTP